MWWLRELAGASAYNMPMVLALEGDIDVLVLQQALDVIAARHEVLRMHYHDGDDGLVGVVSPVRPSNIKLHAVKVADEAQETALMQQEISTQFDLAAAAPVHAILISNANSSHVLCISMHHIAGDGWSSGVLWRELSTAYTALLAGQQPQLPQLPIQYPDYAAWQQEVLASDHAAEWRSYWREALLGAPALLQLPCDRPRPAEPTNAGATIFLDLPRDLEIALRNVAVKLGVNMQAVLLGTLQVSITRRRDSQCLWPLPPAGRRSWLAAGCKSMLTTSSLMTTTVISKFTS
jgi:hypothetical protein